MIKKIKFLFPLLLLIVAAILIGPGLNLGEFWWADESRHAMDGVFIMDLIKDHPALISLYRYTEIYFAKYPALGLSWYPPFFAFVESLFFNVFGISEMTARLTVLFFTLLAVTFLYLLIKEATNEIVALLSCLFFITTPVVVFWARSVMLELPTLSLVILACYFFYHYAFANKPRYVYWLTISLAIALYTKQVAGFIIPVFFGYLFLQREYKKIFNRQMIICLVLFAVMILPLVIFTLKFGSAGLESIGKDMHQLRGATSRMSIEHWLTTFNLFIYTFSWPVWVMLAFFIFSLIFDLFKNKRIHPMILFLFLWIIGWYLAFSYIVNYKPDFQRCCVYIVPAVAVMAIWPLMIYQHKVIRSIIIIMSLIACSYQGFLSYNYDYRYNYIRDYPYISGYREAAKYVMDNYSGQTALFAGYYDGDFIFNVRRYDPNRKAIVLRDSKVLTAWSVYPEWGYQQYVANEEDIYKILNRYGTRYIVVEEEDVFKKKPFKILREMLKKDDFSLEKTIKIKANLRLYNYPFSKQSILIYRYNKKLTIRDDTLTINFPLLNRRIEVPLKSLSPKGNNQ